MGEVHETLATRATARVGRVVCDKWRLDRVLGVGGVAAVYAARHRNGRRVAVKILHPEMAVDASIRRRFLREGYVANRVEHPGAVVVLDDAVDDDGSVLLVMELLEGETLESRCRKSGGQLPPDEVLRIADGVLAVLDSAHAKGILHRDVTPANVFVTNGGEVKLLDFGIARLRDTENSERTVSVPGALGTPAFMPPEQARGLWEELDGRSDLWAVGAVMFRALTGRAVHTGRTPSEQLLAAMTKRARPVNEVLPSVPSSVAKLVDRALRVEPQERWNDAAEFRQAIAESFTEVSGQPLASAPPLVVTADPDANAPGGSSAILTHQDGFGTTIGERTHRTRQLRWAAGVAAVAVSASLGAFFLASSWPTGLVVSRELLSNATERRAKAAPSPAAVEPELAARPKLGAPAEHTPLPRTARHRVAQNHAARELPRSDQTKPAVPDLQASDPLFDLKD